MRTILIVEDSKTQAEHLRSILEAEGYAIVAATDGEAALALISTAEFDLVISDIMMPKMSGYDLCRHIKGGGAKATPVMLLSQLNEPMDIIRGLESGADNFLAKPYKPEELVQRVSAILENRALRANRQPSSGVDIAFLGDRFTIVSEKEQILDLLISTFEDAVRSNRELQLKRAELTTAKIKLEEYAQLLESRVRVSQEKYALLIEHATSGVVLCDTSGRILEANRAAGAIVGASSSDIVGRHARDFAGAPLGDAFDAHWERVLTEGSARIHNVRVLTVDERRVWIDVAASLVKIGDLDYVQVMWHDVTERKTLEDRLRHAQQMRYALLAENTRELLLFIDRETYGITEANAAALEAYGYTREEFDQLSVFDIRAPEERDKVEQVFGRADEGALFETVALRKDGSTFPIEVALRSGVVDGKPVVLEVIRDVTDRKNATKELSRALDDAVAAAQLKSNFVATVSHEIRTPMNGIIGLTELLMRTQMTDDQRESLRTIQESSHALLRIINDILDFSKLEAGRSQLEIVDFDVRSLVEGVVELLGRATRRESVTLMTYVAPGVPSALRGDPGRLRQILMNLAGNAVKFTEAGHVLVSVDVAQSIDHRVLLRFTVSDTGIGMSGASQAQIFHPFAQGDASTTRRFGGTGLGLAISKAYIELMGGTIHVDSVLGEGTEVAFTVVLDSCALAVPAAEADAIIGVRILIVDDDPTARQLLTCYAADWGMTSDTAADPSEAFAKLREAKRAGDPFDVAIVDFVLPGMNGLDLGAEIRRDPELSSMPMMMITAYELDVTERPGPNGVFGAFLRKPIIQSQVYNQLVALLGRSPQPAQTEHAEPRDAQRSPSARRTRVLVAEDNPVNRMVAGRQLSLLGCDVEIVEDGREAFEAVCRETFDVVLMDCSMPVMDGFSATRKIREYEAMEKRPRTPIVAMTASAAEESRNACLAAGMDDYISKPVLLEVLRAAIERVAG